MADIVVIPKSDTAPSEQIEAVRRNIRSMNPEARIVDAAMPVQLENTVAIRGARVLIIEDGPTVTHGDMPYGAGYFAAREAGAKIIDPRPFAVGSLKEVYGKFNNLGTVLPAMGYSLPQIKELEETIAKIECDAVVLGTPIDLRRLINIRPPAYQARYAYQDQSEPTLGQMIHEWWENSPFSSH